MRARQVLAVLLLVSLGVAPASGQDPPASPGDPESAAGQGPLEDEVAFSVSLPGSNVGAPVVLDGAVYTLTNAVDERRGTHGLWRVDLATAKVDRWVAYQPAQDVPCYQHETTNTTGLRDTHGNCYLSSLATDGSRLYVAHSDGVDAIDASGAIVATWERPSLDLEAEHAICRNGLAVGADRVYVMCVVSAPATQGDGWMFVAALGLGDLEHVWTWTRSVADDVSGDQGLPGPLAAPCPADMWTGCPAMATQVTASLVPAGPVVLATTLDNTAEGDYWALDAEEGRLLWSRNASRDVGPDGRPIAYGGPATTDGKVAYMKVHRSLEATNALRDEVLWRAPIGRQDPGLGNLGGGVALAGDHVYVLSFQSLSKFERSGEGQAWVTSLPAEEGTSWSPPSAPSVTEDRIYALSGEIDPSAPMDPTVPRFVNAFDPTTGQRLWHHPLQIEDVPSQGARYPVAMAIEDGVAAVTDIAGNVTVIGRTAASPVAVADVPTRFPAPGQELSVDLSASQAGLMGPTTRFKADWGDGTLTGWQTDPVLSHVYTEAAPREARFWVANEAGQTAVSVHRFEVGGTPPPWWDSFLEDSQGWGLGILGLLLAGGGSAAAYVVGRRRARGGGDPLVVYREALILEIEAGHGPGHTVGRLRDLRASLGISDRQHATLETALRAQMGLDVGRLRVGTVFVDRYEVLEVLGEGGGGVAYRCRDRRIGRDVVLKAVAAPADEPATRGMLQEANAFGDLRHANVVLLYDVEQVGGHVYLVLEHVDGGTLADLLEEGPLPRERAADLARDLLEGLAAIHQAGIVHRDIKPANILVTHDGRFKIADFGVASRLRPAEETDHVAGATAPAVKQASGGTAMYMSPEQARGELVTEAGDLYQAGLVLHEALVGQAYLSASPGEGRAELQARAASVGPFRADRELGSGLQTWFARALDPDPAARFQTANAMLEAFEAAVQ